MRASRGERSHIVFHGAWDAFVAVLRVQGGPAYYSCALPALISTWRAAFEQPDLFFGLMQLAAYPGANSTALAEIRDVQLNTTLATPHTAIASATDLGDLYSPEGCVCRVCARASLFLFGN